MAFKKNGVPVKKKQIKREVYEKYVHTFLTFTNSSIWGMDTLGG